MKQLLLTIGLAVLLGLAQAQDLDPFGVNKALGIGSEQELPDPRATSAKAAPAVTAPMLAPLAPAQFDYSVNLESTVFGAHLFTGTFARQGAAQFNPDYLIAAGDQVQVRFWGAYNHDSLLTVDPKGNIFLPHVGPVTVMGVRNQDLQRVVESAVSKVFRANVNSYASLAAAQPVRVFVGGYVHRPGLYSGTSTDSLLHYLDQAGGIDPERGTFLGVEIKRGDKVRAVVDLYDFLLEGRLPLVQLADGDVIFVPTRKATVTVSGLAENAKRFEFDDEALTVAALIRVAKPLARATHVRVVRNTGTVRNTEYFALKDASSVRLEDGDELEFTADKKPGTITVRVEGEHESAQEYVLPYGATLGQLLASIEFSSRSDRDSLQLFRRSVIDRQRDMLEASLNSLEGAALTARSGTSDEARLRKEEAELLLQWVQRAREIEPRGQVLIAQTTNLDELLLENGDILRIPTRDGLVLVSGEVLFPNAIAFDDRLTLSDYIQKAGGYTQNADAARVLIAHRDGSFSEPDPKARQSQSMDRSDSLYWWQEPDRAPERYASVRPGDEILVLPTIDVKSRQIAKDLTQIIYQVAVSAGVVLGL
jgi:protein involved in polysaccharide export with SLBB domain